MRKYIFLALLITITTFLVSCNGNTTYQVVLSQENQEDIIIETFEQEEIELPMAEKENHFFLGWSDGEANFYNSYLPNQDITLIAEFEHIEDAFANINYNEETQEVIFSDFMGESKHIVLPHSYNGYYVSSISQTFKDSNIESIKIPNSVLSLNRGAFENASNLKEVIFYGDMAGYKRLTMPSDEVETILDEFGCELNFESDPTEDNPWVFPDGCPFSKIIQKSVPVYLPDVGEVYAYTVIQDLSVYSDGISQTFYSDNIFNGANKLEKIHLPKQLNLFSPETFKTNHQLKYVSIDKTHPKYEAIDNILYFEEDTLVFYPGGLESSEYHLPDNITKISNYAFINHHIETLYLHENLESLRGSAFYNLESLENIFIDENHITFKSKDGVLYNKSETILHYYPAGKKATSFTFPSTIELIAEFAFANQKYLETVEFNHGLIDIRKNAFYNVHKINTINLPETVSYIHPNAFYTDNGKIYTVFINNIDEVVTISSHVFKPHDDLKIYVPEVTFDEYFNYPYLTFWGIYGRYLISYEID
ncbi:MAG: leucine-rich repeat protein [Bacillota bacterium]